MLFFQTQLVDCKNNTLFGITNYFFEKVTLSDYKKE